MSKLELLALVQQLHGLLMSNELTKNHIDSESSLTKSQIRRLNKFELANQLIKLAATFNK